MNKRNPMHDDGATALVAVNGDAARTEDAKRAAADLGAIISAAKRASEREFIDAIGADAKPAAVRLAKRAADEAAGLAKSRGGARADALAVLAALDGKPLTARTLVAAATNRLAQNAAAAKSRNDAKRAAAAVTRDATATLAERQDALAVVAAMDAEDANAKRVRLTNAVSSALAAARDGGVTVEAIAHVIAATYGENARALVDTVHDDLDAAAALAASVAKNDAMRASRAKRGTRVPLVVVEGVAK